MLGCQVDLGYLFVHPGGFQCLEQDYVAAEHPYNGGYPAGPFTGEMFVGERVESHVRLGLPKGKDQQR
jgi:hypothetical protein